MQVSLNSASKSRTKPKPTNVSMVQNICTMANLINDRTEFKSLGNL